MSMNDTQSMPLLGRCKHPGCDYALFATDEDVQPAEAPSDIRTGAAYRMGYGFFARCPSNHKIFRLQRIEGTFSEEFKCDSRCLNAKGYTCKCSCGGLNHGKGHAAAVVHTLDPVQDPQYAAELEHEAKLEAQHEGYPRGTTGIRLDAPRKRDTIVDQVKADPEVQRRQAEWERNLTPDFMGEVGDRITGVAKVTWKKDLADSTLYLFRAGEDQNEMPWTLKWFAPSYVNPDFPVGMEMFFKAKVKAHQDDNYGKATLVTYFEATV